MEVAALDDETVNAKGRGEGQKEKDSERCETVGRCQWQGATMREEGDKGCCGAQASRWSVVAALCSRDVGR